VTSRRTKADVDQVAVTIPLHADRRKVEKWSRDGQREPLLTISRLRFGVEAYQTELERANYEARYRCCSSWLDGRGIALDVGVGISLPGTQY